MLNVIEVGWYHGQQGIESPTLSQVGNQKRPEWDRGDNLLERRLGKGLSFIVGWNVGLNIF